MDRTCDHALLRGLVQHGWMYPIERRLCTFKSYVRNRARPEASIEEAYLADEELTYVLNNAGEVDQFVE